MRQTKGPRTSSLFLLELIFSLFFFAVASALCVRIFVRAHVLSRDARALNYGIAACSDAAGITGGADSARAAAEALLLLYPEASPDPDAEDASLLLLAGFDRDLKACGPDSSEAVYRFRVSFYEADSLLHCDASFLTGDGTALYRLSTVHVLRGGDTDA